MKVKSMRKYTQKSTCVHTFVSLQVGKIQTQAQGMQINNYEYSYTFVDQAY